MYQALTLLGRLLHQAGMVTASIWEMKEETEVGFVMALHQVAGMAVSRTLRMKLGTESRRRPDSSEGEEEDKVPGSWRAATAVAEKEEDGKELELHFGRDAKRVN